MAGLVIPLSDPNDDGTIATAWGEVIRGPSRDWQLVVTDAGATPPTAVREYGCSVTLRIWKKKSMRGRPDKAPLRDITFMLSDTDVRSIFNVNVNNNGGNANVDNLLYNLLLAKNHPDLVGATYDPT